MDRLNRPATAATAALATGDEATREMLTAFLSRVASGALRPDLTIVIANAALLIAYELQRSSNALDQQAQATTQLKDQLHPEQAAPVLG